MRVEISHKIHFGRTKNKNGWYFNNILLIFLIKAVKSLFKNEDLHHYVWTIVGMKFVSWKFHVTNQIHK